MALQAEGSALPQCDVGELREAMFLLCWHQHGGSGLNVAYSDVLEMSVAERNWWLQRVAEQRDAEGQALSEAARG